MFSNTVTMKIEVEHKLAGFSPLCFSDQSNSTNLHDFMFSFSPQPLNNLLLQRLLNKNMRQTGSQRVYSPLLIKVLLCFPWQKHTLTHLILDNSLFCDYDDIAQLLSETLLLHYLQITLLL